MRLHHNRTRLRQKSRLVALLFVCSSGLAALPIKTSAQSKLPAPIVHFAGDSASSEVMSRALLIGAVSPSGKWIQDKRAHSSLKSGQIYRLYSMMGFEQESSGGKIELSEASGDAWYIPFKNLKRIQGSLMGIAGPWNALPRPVKSESVTQPAYLKVVTDVLQQRGLTKVKPHISKIIRADLVGKGQESVIIEASSPDLYKDPFADTTIKPGGYSFIIVRTIVKGKVKTLVLRGDYRGNKSGSKGYNICRLSHVLDLNGDGMMEIVVDWSYYEGGGVEVYRLKNGQAQIVLSASDGA